MWARLKSSLRKSEMLEGVPGQDGAVPSCNTSVRVAVRARPLLAKERAAGAKACILAEEARGRVTVGHDRTFTFDHAFSPSAKQSQIYDHCVRQLVEGCFAGYNATVLAYGQTGSGKTHTMGTSGDAAGAEEDEWGITPRAIRQLFLEIEARQQQWRCSVHIQFLEIHNEEVKDLLHPDTLSKNIAIRETSDGQILVAGAQEEPASCGQEAVRLLERGSLSRSTGSTLMNEQSSRSHAIFTLTLEQSPQAGHLGEATSAKLHLVDLAGSERAKKTGAAGKQLKESVGINAGLLALGNVISALGDPKRRPTHVPYRDSKLTRLLQDSLGGNSRTLMIACVTLADTYLEESLNTLKYANRARNIKNQPKINRGVAGFLSGLQEDLHALQMQLVQRQVAQPGLALSPALLFGDPTPWASDAALLTLLKDVASGAVPVEELKLAFGGHSELRLQLTQAHRAQQDQQAEIDRLSGDLMSQQELNSQLAHQASAVLSALDELQERREVSDSARGRLRGLLSTPLWGAATQADVPRIPSIRQSSRLSGSMAGVQRGSRGWLGESKASSTQQLQDMQAHISELEGELRGKSQVLSQCQGLLSEAREDLARDEVIFAGKLKELREVQSIAQQLQAFNAKQAAKHAAEVEELLLELSKQSAAAQAAQPTLTSQDSQSLTAVTSQKAPQPLQTQALPQEASAGVLLAGGAAYRADRRVLAGEGGEGVSSATPPRLTTPTSPVRRPNRGLSGDWGGEVGTSPGLAGLGQAEESGDQVLFGGIPTRPSSASTTGRSTFDVDSTAGSISEALMRAASNTDQAELLSEHRRIQKVQKDLEDQALRESKHYTAQQQCLDRQIRECVYNIRNKEDLIAALQQNETEAKHLSQQYLERLQELERQMVAKEGELKRLKAELEAIDSDRARSEEEKKKMRALFEDKVDQARKQLAQLQKQLRDGDAAKREQARSRDRIKVLESELAHMKSTHTGLHHRIKTNTEAYEREVAARQAEAAGLRKVGEGHRRKVKQLEQELVSQRSIAKRKTDEASALQKRVHQLALESRSGRDKAQAYAHGLSPGSVGSLTPQGSRIGVPPRTPGSRGPRTPGVSKRPSFVIDQIPGDDEQNPGDGPSPRESPKRVQTLALGADDKDCQDGGNDAEGGQTPTPTRPPSAKGQKRKGSRLSSSQHPSSLLAAVEKEISHLLAKKEAEQKLQQLEQTRQALLADREGKQQQRSRLELQLKRISQPPQDSQLMLLSPSQDPDSDAQHCSKADESSCPQAAAAQQLEAASQREEEVQNQAAALDDAIDTCDAQLSYLNKSVAECKQRCAEAAAAAERLRQHADAAGGEEAGKVMQQLISRMVSEQDKQRRVEAKAAEIEVAVAERTQQSANAETVLKLKEMEFERRVTALEREHAGKMGAVLQQISTLQQQAKTAGKAQVEEAHPLHSGVKSQEPPLGVQSKAHAPSQVQGATGEEEQGADLHQLLQLYKEEREQLSKDVLFYKHSCKDLKRRLRVESSLQSSSGTVLSEVSNQSEAGKQQRQLSPGKQNRQPGQSGAQTDMAMAVEGISAFRITSASRHGRPGSSLKG